MEYVTGEQMKEIDHLAIEKYGMDLMDMMEDAGKYLAEVVMNLKPRNIIIFYGGGHNAGGGLVAARHILDQNCSINLISATDDIDLVTSFQLDRLRLLGVQQNRHLKIQRKTVVIDALMGYGLQGEPRGKYKELITKINNAKAKGAKVVSLDVPSGVDATTGQMYEPHVTADYTVTLALPKVGLKKAKSAVGKLFLANIGIPVEVYDELGIKVEKTQFKKDNLISVSV